MLCMELGAVNPLRVRAPKMSSDKPNEENGWVVSMVILYGNRCGIFRLVPELRSILNTGMLFCNET
ncbi:hypothetical protein AGMMS49942_22470 [Spirochaetia bacterium]|nr:hypothetical protein AGMMS49942_22470 [Spirochaetia bacterium]